MEPFQFLQYIILLLYNALSFRYLIQKSKQIQTSFNSESVESLRLRSFFLFGHLLELILIL